MTADIGSNRALCCASTTYTTSRSNQYTVSGQGHHASQSMNLKNYVIKGTGSGKKGLDRTSPLHYFDYSSCKLNKLAHTILAVLPRSTDAFRIFAVHVLAFWRVAIPEHLRQKKLNLAIKVSTTGFLRYLEVFAVRDYSTMCNAY